MLASYLPQRSKNVATRWFVLTSVESTAARIPAILG